MADKQLDFLNAVAGQGFEQMKTEDSTTPMLLIAQPLSGIVQDGNVKPGDFYNSATGRSYGSSVDAVVVDFQKVWYEWLPNQGGLVGRWPVGGIDVTGDRYSGMMHGENKVIETWIYAVILPEHLDDGIMLFQSTPGNMRYLKSWNTQMRYQRLPNGTPAPIFAQVWTLKTNKDSNKAGQPFFSCNESGKSSIRPKEPITKELYDKYIAPARNSLPPAEHKLLESETEEEEF